MLFADRIRQLRRGKQLLQRQFAIARDIDRPLFSKIERNEYRAQSEQVVVIAKILKYNETKLLNLWLADQVTAMIAGDKTMADKALNIVKENIK